MRRALGSKLDSCSMSQGINFPGPMSAPTIKLKGSSKNARGKCLHKINKKRLMCIR
jgi:hypothetical protein